MYTRPLLKNIKDIENISWEYLDRESYEEMEKIFTDGVVFFEPFLVDNFYSEEDFNELVNICNSFNLEEIDYSNQMNKWEQAIPLPQKFIDIAVEKVKHLIGTDDVLFGYMMYAHHQITEDGRVPKLPVHIDWSPGSYMIDLHIGGNRDWGFVAGDKEFITKPNQAVICQPQFDYHYRPSWNSSDPSEYYQALFFHLINKNHWCVPNSATETQNRSKELNAKYEFGRDFRETDIFKNFQSQRSLIFEYQYWQDVYSMPIGQPVQGHEPSVEDANIHDRKGVKPKL